MKSPRAVFLAFFIVALIGTPDVALAAWPNDPGANLRIAPTSNEQSGFFTVADGEGGAFYVWGEISRVFAQHRTAQGLVAPGWPASGLLVSGSSGGYCASVAADGEGGFIALWTDYSGSSPDVYAQRVSAEGTMLWPADGAPVCTEGGEQSGTSVCSDLAGGAIFAWRDRRDAATNNTDLYAQRLSAAGVPLWTPSGVPVCTETGWQEYGAVVSDGTVGGSFVTWQDLRSGAHSDLYASRLDRDGYLRSGWTPNGDAVCAAAHNQESAATIPDGAFGAFVTWMDSRFGYTDIYVIRMSSLGPTAPGWPTEGLQLTSDISFQAYPALASDGAGGAVVTWADSRNSSTDIYAQRVSAAGVAAWATGGIPLTAAQGSQTKPTIIPDGAGGAVVGWQDFRLGEPTVIFAQRVTGAGTIAAGFAADGNPLTTGTWVQYLSGCSDGAGGAIFTWQDNITRQGFTQRIDRWGYLGAQPRIASVKDVPNDQGGRVKVSWDRSPLDAYPENAIASYLVYRSVPPLSALSALDRGEAVIGEARDAAGPAFATPRRTFLTSAFEGNTYYWEYLTTVAASQLTGYSYVAATEQDSIPDSNPETLFMVRAQDGAGARFWLSDPEGGYSTDDLAPAAPAPFSGVYAAGATHLHWGANGEADFALYRLYRGSSAGFVPGPGNRIAAQADTGYRDAGAAGSYYKLTAVDVHGNESPARILAPGATVDAPATSVAWTLALAPAFPNPSARVTTCRFTLPSDGPVRVAVHDAAGRVVRVLLDAGLPAGEHAVRWGGEDDLGGRTPSGLYFAKLSFAGRMLTTKVVRVE